MEDSYHKEMRSICLDDGGWDNTVPQLYELQDKLCQHVRSIYVHHRRRFDENNRYGINPVLRYDGGTDRSGKTYPVFWPTLLRHFLRLQVDPEAFTAAQFRVARDVPLPPHLLEEPALVVYKRFEAEAEERELARMERDRQHVHGEAGANQRALNWDALRSLRYGLFSGGHNQIIPLLRYCLAVEHDCDDIADYFREDATITYCFQRRFYEEAGVVQIPDCLRNESKRLVEWISNRPARQ